MKQLIRLAAACLLGLCAASLTSAATLKKDSRVLQGAVEGVTLKFYLSGDLSGVVVARECANCDPKRFKVTPKMRVMDLARSAKPIEWDASLDLGERKADLLYMPESKEVFEIFLHPSP